jgi:PAS domain S-box-containing protein
MQNSPQEIKLLQSCINDLTSLLSLPAIWSGSNSSQIVISLLDAVVSMLRLDFAYARFLKNGDRSATEVLRLANPQTTSVLPEDVGLAFKDSLTDASPTLPASIPNPIGEGEVFIAPLRLGLQDEIGFLVAASKRRDFPTRIETLLLQVAANQAVVGLGLDTAERKRADERLREYEKAIENLEEMIVVVDRDYRYRVANRAYLTYRGLEREKLEGRLVPELLHAEVWERIAKEKMDEALQGKVVKYEIRYDYPKLGKKDLSVSYFPIEGPSGIDRVVCVLQDITDRKQAEEELRKAQAELAHVSRVTTLGELTASIAHEVNQPLAAIVTNGQASLRLLSRSKPDIDEARAALESMISDSLRASKVIKRIRALLKKTEPAKSTLSLNAAIREVIAIINEELKKNQISLVTELAPDLPLVIADRIQLQQVMLNLILNSNEAMSAPGWQTRELLLRSEQTGPDWVQVTVKDTGIGLGSNDHERVFDAFFTGKEGGLGLGLSISRTIIEDHGGRLWAMPNEGLGASFQFRLPTVIENQ